MKPPKTPRDIQAAVVRAAIARQLEQRLTTAFNRALQTVAYEEFRALRKAGQAQPWRLGQQVHRRMATEIAQLAGRSPGLEPFAEKSLATVVEAVRAAHPELAPRCAARGGTAPDGRPDAARPPGPGSAAAARRVHRQPGRDRRGEGARHPPGRTVPVEGVHHGRGSPLRPAARRPRGGPRHERRLDLLDEAGALREDLGTVADDLGETFDGRWEAIAEAYQRAAKGGVPAEVVAGLDELTAHAVRETVVRQAALSQLFPGSSSPRTR
ncbi:hypothetical protein V2I01_12310 [Micromonospora sp. BRA006-A]|nr:hypothetical protein [Micromonospora sp. BRA006-A]